MRRFDFRQGPISLGCWLMAATGLCAAERPNILLIFTDDQGMGDVSCYGSDIPTPHIDSIAQSGIKFDAWYVTAPVCTPSRYSLLTGRYPGRSRDDLATALMARQEADFNKGIRPDETTIATVLRKHGYQTAIIGKWHLGLRNEEFRPTRHGFDSFYGHMTGVIDYFTMTWAGMPDWYRNETPIKETGYATDLLTNEAVRFLEAQEKDRPFFLYLSYNAPHAGITRDSASGELTQHVQPHPEYLTRFKHIAEPKRRAYAAMVGPLDDGIGRVLKILRKRGLDDKTLVIFMSDNGAIDKHGGCNLPFRGAKATLYEGGIRVPCLMQWTGRIEAGTTTKQVGSSLDIFPTLCRLAGAGTTGLPLDGIDLTPFLFRGKTLPPRSLFWSFTRKGKAFRQGPWKYVKHKNLPEMLFNLDSDPYETKNLADQHPDLLAKLKKAHTAVAATFPAR